MAGEMKEVVLLDVTPLSLGVETLGRVMTTLIARNTTVPTSKSEIFSTAADNQTSVEIHVLQGERPIAADNKSLGRFILDGVPPAPRGVPQVEVVFDIDANGILNVTAKEKTTGKEQSIKITGSTGLSKEEVEKIQKEAEGHEAEDQKKKELIDARNIADTLVYTAEKALKDGGEKVPVDVKTEVEEKVKAAKESIGGEDLEKIKSATDELGKVLQKIGPAMSQTPPGSDKTAAGAQEEIKGEKKEEEKKDEPVEGEVVDEEKKNEKRQKNN